MICCGKKIWGGGGVGGGGEGEWGGGGGEGGEERGGGGLVTLLKGPTQGVTRFQSSAFPASVTYRLFRSKMIYPLSILEIRWPLNLLATLFALILKEHFLEPRPVEEMLLKQPPQPC